MADNTDFVRENSEERNMFMPKMKKDGYARISKTVLIRRKNGMIENISGQTVHMLALRNVSAM